MIIEFEPNSNLKEDQIEVKVVSVEETQQVKKLIDYIKNFDKKVDSILPVKAEDRILTVKIDEIIKIEVEKTKLTFIQKMQLLRLLVVCIKF